MALIKDATAKQLARDAVVLDFGDLQRQARAIMDAARAEADRIVADARIERERILAGAAEQGRAAGFEMGVTEGRATGRAQAYEAALVERRETLTRLESAWSAALGQLEAQREAIVQGGLRDVVRLGVCIGERVIKRSIKADAGIVVDQVRAALEVVSRASRVEVRVHPEDRELVAAALPGLTAMLTNIRAAGIAEDATLERGSCVVRTLGDQTTGDDAGGGRIDASIATQIDRIAEALIPGETSSGRAALMTGKGSESGGGTLRPGPVEGPGEVSW